MVGASGWAGANGAEGAAAGICEFEVAERILSPTLSDMMGSGLDWMEWNKKMV